MLVDEILIFLATATIARHSLHAVCLQRPVVCVACVSFLHQTVQCNFAAVDSDYLLKSCPTDHPVPFYPSHSRDVRFIYLFCDLDFGFSMILCLFIYRRRLLTLGGPPVHRSRSRACQSAETAAAHGVKKETHEITRRYRDPERISLSKCKTNQHSSSRSSRILSLGL